MISGESGLEAGPKASTHMGTVDCSGSESSGPAQWGPGQTDVGFKTVCVCVFQVLSCLGRDCGAVGGISSHKLGQQPARGGLCLFCSVVLLALCCEEPPQASILGHFVIGQQLELSSRPGLA